MTNLNVLLERMASLYGLAFLGWWLAKRKFLSAEQIAGLAKVVVDVCMPALFFIAIDFCLLSWAIAAYLTADLYRHLLGSLISLS
jgi:predicted permease